MIRVGSPCFCFNFVAKSGSKEEEDDVIVLWVDDNPANNKKEVTAATTFGVKVVQKISTTEAQDYLKENANLLKASSNYFRVITDK